MFTNDPVVLQTTYGQHPLLWALERAKGMFDMNQTALATALEVLPQTVSMWKRFAAADGNYLLPAEQVPPLCALLGIEPNLLRPDLWPRADWVFTVEDTIYLRTMNYARAGVMG